MRTWTKSENATSQLGGSLAINYEKRSGKLSKGHASFIILRKGEGPQMCLVDRESLLLEYIAVKARVTACRTRIFLFAASKQPRILTERTASGYSRYAPRRVARNAHCTTCSARSACPARRVCIYSRRRTRIFLFATSTLKQPRTSRADSTSRCE